MAYHIVGIGEILWDVFPDDRRFGGAPANFACSAAELAQDAANVFMVSAVGDDDLGRDPLTCSLCLPFRFLPRSPVRLAGGLGDRRDQFAMFGLTTTELTQSAPKVDC